MGDGRREHRSRRGFALIAVLWLMTVLSAVVLQASLFTRLHTHATRNTTDGVLALFLARAGIERAVADLRLLQTRVVSLDELRESETGVYCNVECGSGSYTLLTDNETLGNEPDYGIMDECGRINLNEADQTMLSSLPDVSPDLAAAIVQLRGDIEQIHEIGDLMMLEGADAAMLYGEDSNGNGLLDPWEDDGTESWPPDNADGRLDRGIAQYLTCWSAVRNVTVDGEERVDISSADANEITQKLPDVTRRQANSIVEHRNKHEFKSIADLLDVMLVEQRRGEEHQDDGDADEDAEESESNREGGSSERSSDRGESRNGSNRSQTTSTNAFDTDAFKRIADLVTISSDDVLKGRINVNTAPREVLACLPGVSEELAMEIEGARGEGAFETVGDLLDVSGMTTETFKGICNHVSVRSDVFTARSFGVLVAPDGSVAACRCVQAVIDRTDEEAVRIVSWRELD